MEATAISKKTEWVKSLSTASTLSTIAPELAALSAQALETTDFPTTRVEDWKYTRTTRISNAKWNVAPSAQAIDLTPFLIEGLDACVYVFLDGFFRSDLSSVSTIEGVSIESISQLSDDSKSAVAGLLARRHSKIDFFTALHNTHITDGIYVRVKRNTIATKAIHCLFLQSTEQSFGLPILAGSLEQNSQLHVVCTFATIGGVNAFTQAAIDWEVESNAQLNIDKIQMEGEQSFHLSQENIYQARDSRFTINTMTVDGNWVRNNLNIRLDGENCLTHLNGIYLPRGTQHVDNHTLVDHLMPHCESNELYKGVMFDQSKAVFNGKVYVRPDAQKTNAYQTNANIMMSDDASVNTKPELEIYADDVKCSHGTTTGQFNEEALFYLKARAIGPENAKKLLTAAFLGDVVNKIENEAVQSFVFNQLQEKNLLWM
ncbi:MAG: Fe-S cluster assembly protein SufD [Flavobacteriales bacterium]